jgi:putative SOS response-associated peptidase YedK
MCGRYASSRRPEDLIEEFEVVDNRVPAPLAPDYNVAPTKEVYAVVERPPSKEAARERGHSAGEPPERQLRVVTWGLVPSWAKDRSIGNRMINARMETVAEKPAYKRALAVRRCLLPADGYFEWYPTEEKTKAGKPKKQPFFIRPKDDGSLAMAGLYEIWRDPAKADDADDRFLWTCTVITTDAEDDVGHIHDRMPLMVEKDRSIGNRMINARMETVAEKPAYRKAFASRRCLLPADGYYEWYPTEQLTAKGRPRKQPFFIRPRDHGTLAMAGLYEIWRDPTRAEDDPDRFRWTCTVITTAAEDSLGHLHDRMPLMVERDRWDPWLSPTSDQDSLLDLLFPASPGVLEAYPVSPLVSNVRNNGPELVDPLPLDEVPLPDGALPLDDR